MSQEGKYTSEFKQARGAGWLGYLLVVLGAVVSMGPMVVETLPVDSKAAVIAGSIVVIAGALVKLMSALGYTTSRTRVKEAEAAGELDPEAASRMRIAEANAINDNLSRLRMAEVEAAKAKP